MYVRCSEIRALILPYVCLGQLTFPRPVLVMYMHVWRIHTFEKNLIILKGLSQYCK